MSTPIRYDAITATEWQPKLGELGVIVVGDADVDQCIRTILTTPKGSVPHRPDFGTDLWRFIDLPIAEARPVVVQEVVASVARWEPRAEITSVRLVLATSGSGWVIELTRRMRSDGALRTSQVEVVQ